MAIETRFKQGTIVFDNWEIVEYIGNGSGGKTAVFQIVRQNQGVQENSALKVINVLEEFGKKNDLAEDYRQEYEAECKELCHLAQEELRLMSCLRGCSNIVDYYDSTFVEYQEENVFGVDLLIRIEFLENMREEQKKKGTYSEAEIIRIGKDICKGLEFCHQKGIIHRDIKPANMYVTEEDTYKLGDFGIARMVDAGQQASTKMGTRAYAAPEQFMSYQEKYDERVDIYSLGLTLYELANGNKLPFASSAYVRESEIQLRIMGKEFPVPENASPMLAEVIKKACAHKPEDRYASVEEFRDALCLLESGPTEGRITKGIRRNKKNTDSKKIKITIAAILCFGLIAFGISCFDWERLASEEATDIAKGGEIEIEMESSEVEEESLETEMEDPDIMNQKDLPSHKLTEEDYEKLFGKVASVKSQYGTIAVITEKGDLYMWGENSYGQVGCGHMSKQDTPVYIMSDVSSVELGACCTAAVTTSGDLYMWGYDIGANETYQPTPFLVLTNVKEVKTDGYTKLALCHNGELYGWGTEYGSGYGAITDIPQLILENVVCFDLGELDVGGAVTEEGDLYMWGKNNAAQLGTEERKSSPKPVKVMGDVKSIHLDLNTTAAITNNGDLYMWGENEHGQIKRPWNSKIFSHTFIMSNVESVTLTSISTAIITKDKELYSWGVGFLPSLDLIAIAENVKDVFFSETVSGYLTEEGKLFLCGENGNKQIRDSERKEITEPTYVAGNIRCVAFTEYYTYVVDNDGKFYQWGD